MKVVILIPYFGNWPAWMDYFLVSCEKNPSYNWIIFSDNPNPANTPDNVVIESFSLSEFNKMASTELGLDIHIRNPYKICDLRPAFGVIFSKFLKDADFWAYSDLDLVYGNIDRFLSQEIFENHDIITSRKEYLAGHFTLYRNDKIVNELYKLSPLYQEIFQDNSRHFAFDERSNLYGRRLYENELPNRRQKICSGVEYNWHRFKKKVRLGIPGEPRDINSIVNQESDALRLKVYRKNMVRSDKWYEKQNIREWKVKWDNGQLSDASSGQELLHFHFLEGKNRQGFNIDPMSEPGSFSITAEGIRHY